MHKRPAQYTSTTDYRNGLMGKRHGHAFTGADGYQCDADWNAGFNLAKWEGFSCALDLKEAVPVMGSVASERGVFDSPLNFMKALKGEQLELFSLKRPRRENPPFSKWGSVNQLIFIRSRETPNGYKDEGHSLEIGLIPLQIGDMRRWDDEVWQVAHVETYSASTETNNTFHLAVLTPDGTLTNPLSLRIGDQRLLHLYFSSEDFALTWPEPSECLPHVGHEAPPLEGWQVERMQEFASDRTQILQDRVLVCWCIPFSVKADQAA
ncbi:MAG: hypothetical protein AAGF98_13030 [Cyanobacteria bacterium P01_H01_bin.153]